MAAGFEITVDDARANRALAALADAGTDLAPVMDEIGAMLVAATLDRFERGVAPNGTPWKPSGRAQREGGQTLVDSARLRDSITHDFDARSVTVGTNVVYAAIHQLGGTIRPKSGQFLKFPGPDGAPVFARQVEIPARPFLGISDGDAAEIGDIVADHLREAFR